MIRHFFNRETCPAVVQFQYQHGEQTIKVNCLLTRLQVSFQLCDDTQCTLITDTERNQAEFEMCDGASENLNVSGSMASCLELASRFLYLKNGETPFDFALAYEAKTMNKKEYRDAKVPDICLSGMQDTVHQVAGRLCTGEKHLVLEYEFAVSN